MAFKNSVATLLASGALVTGCALDVPKPGSGIQINIVDSAVASGQELMTSLGFGLLATPTSTASFNCFAANVTGAGINPDSRLAGTCTSTDNWHARSVGLLSKVTQRGAAIELDIPAGQRAIDIYGINPGTNSCLDVSGGVSGYWLGGVAQNLIENSVVNVPITFASGTQANVSCDGGSAPAAPVIKSLDASWLSLANLTAYFNLNETPATHLLALADSSTSALTASLTTNDGATNKSVAGKVSTAISFDGADDKVTVTDPGAASALDFGSGTSISISAWITPATLPNTGEILCKNSNYGIQTGDGTAPNTQKLTFYYFDGSTWQNYRTTANVLTTGVATHVAFTYTFATGASAIFYVNGASVIGSWTSGSGNTAPVQDNLAMTIGYCAASTFFNGTLDDVAVWKRGLSAAEVNTIYTRQL